MSLFDKYHRVLVFDTETTGLDPVSDEIIQFSAVEVTWENGFTVTPACDTLIALSPGKTVPPKVEALTGITTRELQERGRSKESVCKDITALLERCDLLATYNANFDLCFLFYFLRQLGAPLSLLNRDKLDLLTVYRDRRGYPHKLASAIDAYGLSDTVCNSHRAGDDTLAAAWLMNSLAAERDDLERYVNLFGYIRRYGVPKPSIRSITYRPQGYEPEGPIYDLVEC